MRVFASIITYCCHFFVKSSVCLKFDYWEKTYKKMLLVIGDHPLTPWEKIAIIFLGGSIVMITMLIVACIVFPTCALFKWLNRGKFFKTYFFIFHSTTYWEQLFIFYVETQLIRLIRETKKKSSNFFNLYV